MNYVRHLNAFFALVRSDQRLTSSHVSLYMALFQYWNFNRFNNPFSIYRENIMQLSKLSKNTYHKCIKELHEAKYIFYHPSSSKFQAVRISVVRLDKEEETPSRYQQLDLFASPSLTGEGFRVGSSLKNETGTVANLRPHSPNSKTGTVAKLGHIIKPNNQTERNTPSPDFWEEENKKKKAGAARVSNSIHGKVLSEVEGSADGNIERSRNVPSLNEVEELFKILKYPNEEAIKFFSHYKSLGWKIQGKTPIEDWKPLVEKWMTNAKRWNTTTEQSLFPSGRDLERGPEINYLYNCFLEGKKIFHQITEDHFEQLNLSLNEETMQQARQQRINDVAGTNQYSLNQLWQAYLKGNKEDPLIIKDTPTLVSLAKRIAVLQHFHTLKNKQL